MYPDYLERIRKTNPQKELDANERMKNLKNAFKIGENDVKLDKVLIVDDIYTSGATIEACTQALKNKGIRNIYYVSVAIGKGYSVWK
jgi:predicted amidophosphoribosyltransferase